MENVPIYVKVDKYRELLDVVKAIDGKIEVVNKTIEKINALKNEEDAQIKQWVENLADIKMRLERINGDFHNQ